MASDPLPRRRYRDVVVALALPVLLGAICRVAFVAATELPRADPWRHLQLVDNIRAGAGFTLFDGQPYLWYSPLWYHFAAALGPSDVLQWTAAGCSLLACLLFGLYLYWRQGDGDVAGVFVGALLMAGFGPLVASSCQYGSEGFALALLTAALAVAVRGRSAVSGAAAGALFGLCLIARLHFAFSAFLFLPLFATTRRAAAFGIAAAIPLVAQWWRNHQIISGERFVFTWDGLASRGGSFSFFSELVPQLHPDVVAATGQLYRQILPLAQWYFDGRVRWEIVLFGAIGLVCLIACRQISVMLAGFSAIAYFCFLDKTSSALFFRIWVVVLPVFMVAVADVATRYLRVRPEQRWQVMTAAVLLTLTGVADLRPKSPLDIDAVTLAPEALTQTHYLVNSAFYHPQALIRRYPDKHFIGMPWNAADFADFQDAYPQYRSQIWHERFNIQGALLEKLRAGGEFTETRVANRLGHGYLLLERQAR